MTSDYRKFFENLIDEIHQEGFRVTDDYEEGEERFVLFEQYQLVISLTKREATIDFDIYANLKSGIYELGDLHLLSRKMLTVKKICMAHNAREMNTTERLYPKNRQGKNTETSGL